RGALRLRAWLRPLDRRRLIASRLPWRGCRHAACIARRALISPLLSHDIQLNGDAMQRLILLHSNDIHGRVAGLARIATLVAETRRAHSEVPVLYLDLGDLEDTTNRLSNLTKGVAMHRLLSVAGCDAAVIGNACAIRYGPGIVTEQAKAAR